MMVAGKLKVFESLGNWWKEFRKYSRDDKGNIVRRLSRKLCFEPWSFSSLKPRLEHGIELRQDGDDAVIRDAPFSVFE